MDSNNDFNNDNQNYSIYGDDTQEQNSFNKFKRINDYIENHYHDSNSDDVDMDGNNIGKFIDLIQIERSNWFFVYRLTTQKRDWFGHGFGSLEEFLNLI